MPSDRKFLFLDFDGVLNSEKFFVARIDKPKNKEESNITNFDPKAIALLNHIIENTGALIVVSSTWRKSRTIEELQQLLGNVGVVGQVYSKTPVFNEEYVFRGNEIEAWLQKEQQTEKGISFSMISPYKYVILDDDSDMMLHQKDFFVKCSYKTGLTKSLANKAIKILNQ